MPRSLQELLVDRFGTRAIPGVNPQNLANIGLTAARILGFGPNRLSFLFINTSANAIYVHLDNTVSTSKGIFCGAGGGGFSMTWEEDFELVSNEWYAIATGVASTFLVVEVQSAGA